MIDVASNDLTGQVALIVSATGGIGAATAVALAAAGAHVILAARHADQFDGLKRSLPDGSKISELLIDLDKTETIDNAAADVERLWGKLDILVAAGGVFGEIAPVHELDAEAWRQAFEVNVASNVSLIRAFHPLMEKSAAARAIFIGSGAARAPRPTWAAYCASKAGLELLVRTYAMETEGTNIRPMLVNPGAVRTRMRADLFPDEDPAAITAPEEVAELILDMCRAETVAEPIIWFAEWRKARESAGHAPG